MNLIVLKIKYLWKSRWAYVCIIGFSRDNFIKKQPTSEIIITYGLSDAGRIQLDELNKMIAKEKGVKVSELAEQNASSEDLADEKKETKKDAKKTSKKN